MLKFTIYLILFILILFILIFYGFIFSAPNRMTIETYFKNFERQKSTVYIYDKRHVYSYTIQSLEEKEIKLLEIKLKEIFTHSGRLDLNSYAPLIKIVSTDYFINFHENRTIIGRRIMNTKQWTQYSRPPIDQDIKFSKYLEEIYLNNKNACSQKH